VYGGALAEAVRCELLTMVGAVLCVAVCSGVDAGMVEAYELLCVSGWLCSDDAALSLSTDDAKGVAVCLL